MKKILITLCIVLTFASGLHAESNAESVLERVPEMGILGHKLKVFQIIEGINETRNPRKLTHSRMILVDTVNSEKLENPIHLFIKNVNTDTLAAGTRCIFEGYESGEWIGCNMCQTPRQFLHYFIVSDVIKPEGLEFTPPPAESQDSIDRFTAELSGNPLWMNGGYPAIKLPQKAKHDEVIAECFKLTGFDQGHVKDYKIVKIKKVNIRSPLPEDYFAALTDTDLGKKIVLFRYESLTTGWWTRVYDLK